MCSKLEANHRQAQIHDSAWVKLSSDFREIPNQQDEIKNNLMIDHKTPGKSFPYLEEADNQNFSTLMLLNYPRKAFSELEDDDSDIAVQRPQHTTSGLENNLMMVEDSNDHVLRSRI
jgi:hypothetical protein